MGLPLQATVDDLDTVAGYLKNKPTGATIDEAKAVIGGEALDGRKIAAYVRWGLVDKEGDRLKLTERGRDFARTPALRKDVFRSVIGAIKPYRSVLEWAFHQGLQEITNIDVAAQWHDHHSDALETTNETSINRMAVCFLRICEPAGLGSFILGRHGQSTRLTINREGLREFIEGGPALPPWSEEPSEQEDEPAPLEIAVEESEEEEDEAPHSPPTSESAARPRVFISHGRDMTFVDQVETMLELAGMESEVAVKEETAAIPVPEKVFSAMRRCQAGIIVVTAEERPDSTGDGYRLNENVLIEIGAAFVLYDRQVVLLWDKRLPVPSNLQGLYRCEFEGDELSWDAGMKLMKAIRQFKA
jgi:predicted nucleotide-binding protein